MATTNQKFLNYEGLKEVFNLLKETYLLKDDMGNFVEQSYVDEELAKKADKTELAKYATNESVQEAVADMATKTYVDGEIANAVEGYAKESWVLEKNYTTIAEVNTKLDDYVTKVAAEKFFDEVEYKKEEKEIVFYNNGNEKGKVDCKNFIIEGILTSAEITEENKLKLVFSSGEEIELDLSDIFDVDNYYSKEQVDAELAKKLDVQTYNEDKSTFETKTHAEETYAKKTDIPSIDGFATKEWVENKNYLTEHQSLADYAKKTEVIEEIEDHLKTYATKSYVTDRIAEIIFPEDGETPEFSLDGYLKEEVAEATYVAKEDALTVDEIKAAFNEVMEA